jgi:hypothetical protein
MNKLITAIFYQVKNSELLQNIKNKSAQSDSLYFDDFVQLTYRFCLCGTSKTRHAMQTHSRTNPVQRPTQIKPYTPNFLEYLPKTWPTNLRIGTLFEENKQQQNH